MVHTEQCLERQKKLEEFLKLWPKACMHCGGYGVTVYLPTRDDPGGPEPCDYCLGDEHCPRCGSENLTLIEHREGEYGHCNNCNWDEWSIASRLEGWELMVAPWDGDCECYTDEILNYPDPVEVEWEEPVYGYPTDKEIVECEELYEEIYENQDREIKQIIDMLDDPVTEGVENL